MLNDTGHITTAGRARSGHRSAARVNAQHDSIVKSATRALEIIELFAVHRQPLSVTEIADALAIPQSSSSVLLQAMTNSGFITRDKRTRKYLPSIRSVFLGNWIHDALFRNGSLLRALDTLSETASANVRLGVRNGIHVQYVHISWPAGEADTLLLAPGMKMPICHDAIGQMLLAAESDQDVRAIVRHANAVGEGPRAVHVEAFMQDLGTHRAQGFAEAEDLANASECVIAVQLPSPFGVPAAIGLGVAAERLPEERVRLLRLLNAVVKSAWGHTA
jgi:DNA-binding IclR family transcriptional regulator